MKHWYLLTTKPREDDRAEQHLRNQHYEIFRPRLRRARLRQGRQVSVVESLFPRYIFIRLDEEYSNWSCLRSTRGVAGLVRFGELPAVVPDTLIAELRQRVDADGVLEPGSPQHKPSLFQAGDRVEIGEGSFRGLQAIVQNQRGEERVVILLNLLGRQQRLTLPLNQVRAL